MVLTIQGHPAISTCLKRAKLTYVGKAFLFGFSFKRAVMQLQRLMHSFEATTDHCCKQAVIKTSHSKADAKQSKP